MAYEERAQRGVWRWKNETTPNVLRQWWILLLAATCAAPVSPYGVHAPGPALSRSLCGLPLLPRPASELRAWSRPPAPVRRMPVRGHTGVSASVRTDSSECCPVAASWNWVRQVVVGLNLCPWAKSAIDEGLVNVVLSKAQSTDELLSEIRVELLRLAPDTVR